MNSNETINEILKEKAIAFAQKTCGDDKNKYAKTMLILAEFIAMSGVAEAIASIEE